MVDSGTIKRSDREILEDLMSFRDTREEVIRETAHKDIVKRMLEKGLSAEKIAEFTGISLAQIEKFQAG